METKNILRRNIIFVSVLSVLYLLYTAVLTPIYTYVCTDIIYSEGYLPGILELCLEICQLLIWCHLFGSIIASFSLRGAKRSAFILISAPILILLRYFLVLIFGVTFDDASVGSQDLLDALLYFIFDVTQLVAACLVSNIIIKSHGDRLSELPPFGRTDIRATRIRISAGICAGIITAVRIAMRIRYDIFYGAPEDLTDLMWMIAYYTSDLVYGFLSYLLILGIVWLQCKNKKNINK